MKELTKKTTYERNNLGLYPQNESQYLSHDAQTRCGK